MKAQVKLGRIAGISIGLNYSWFIIALLIALSLVQHFHMVAPHWGSTIVWIAAVVTALLFFVTLLLHELAHSLVAKTRGLRVRAITLFALGGVSQIETESPDAKSEFWIAIAGPLTSIVIGLVLLGVAAAAGWTLGAEPATPVISVLVWLGYINVSLAVFNMIPGYPLDGGRVLRAVIWWITGSVDRSTRLAAQVGQLIALLFILLGLFRFFAGGNFGALWLAFIGWFLLDASRSSYVQSELMTALRNRRVADIMDRDCAIVEGHVSLQDLVDEYVLRTGRRCFIVVQNGALSGLITTNEIKAVDRESWPRTSVQSVMRPISQLRTVSPETPATQALELMGREDMNQLPVISNGHLEGVITRGHVLSFLSAQAELGHR